MTTPAHTMPAGPIVVGLTEIGNLFGRSRWTIRRWIDTEAFPASQLPDGSWTTSLTLVDRWLMEQAEWGEEEDE